MVLSQMQLAYLFYFRITAFVNLRLTPLEYQKVEKQQQQNR